MSNGMDRELIEQHRPSSKDILSDDDVCKILDLIPQPYREALTRHMMAAERAASIPSPARGAEVTEEMVRCALTAYHGSPHPIGDEDLDATYQSAMRSALSAALAMQGESSDGRGGR